MYLTSKADILFQGLHSTSRDANNYSEIEMNPVQEQCETSDHIDQSIGSVTVSCDAMNYSEIEALHVQKQYDSTTLFNRKNPCIITASCISENYSLSELPTDGEYNIVDHFREKRRLNNRHEPDNYSSLKLPTEYNTVEHFKKIKGKERNKISAAAVHPNVNTYSQIDSSQPVGKYETTSHKKRTKASSQCNPMVSGDTYSHLDPIATK